jgi:uncharacterized protein
MECLVWGLGAMLVSAVCKLYPRGEVMIVTMSTHSSHPDVIKRLKRAAGHLQSVIAMLEQEKPCLDVAQQLQAVESAVANAKKTLVRDHIDHCLEHAMGDDGLSAQDAVREFKAITKYL